MYMYIHIRVTYNVTPMIITMPTSWSYPSAQPPVNGHYHTRHTVMTRAIRNHFCDGSARTVSW